MVPQYKPCYAEVNQAGSCLRKEGCKFSHEIPTDIRKDKQRRNEILKEAESRRSMCVNEFRKAGSCRKGHLCTHRHDISEEERNDWDTRTEMQLKYERVVGSKTVRKTNISTQQPTNNQRESESPKLNQSLSQNPELRKILIQLTSMLSNP